MKNLIISEVELGHFLTHASYKDMFRYHREDTTGEQFSVFDDVEEDIILLGLTHVPMNRTVQGKRYSWITEMLVSTQQGCAYIERGGIGRLRRIKLKSIRFYILSDDTMKRNEKKIEINDEKISKQVIELLMGERDEEDLKEEWIPVAKGIYEPKELPFLISVGSGC